MGYLQLAYSSSTSCRYGLSDCRLSEADTRSRHERSQAVGTQEAYGCNRGKEPPQATDVRVSDHVAGGPRKSSWPHWSCCQTSGLSFLRSPTFPLHQNCRSSHSHCRHEWCDTVSHAKDRKYGVQPHRPRQPDVLVCDAKLHLVPRSSSYFLCNNWCPIQVHVHQHTRFLLWYLCFALVA